MGSYAIETPATKREGLANAVKMAINALDAGDVREAFLQMEGILDDVMGESNPYNIDPQAKTPKAKRKPRAKRGLLTEPAKFKKGDRVKIAPTCQPWEGRYAVGDETTVRAVKWDNGGGGQDAGWVCEVNLERQPGRPEHGFLCFWERLLEPAGAK